MKKRILIIVLILFIFSIVGCTGKNTKSSIKNITNDKQLTQKEKLDDFEYMYTILKENYPYFEVNKRLNEIDWLANKNKYLSKIKFTNNDDDFIKAIQSILADLNNGHTNALDKGSYSYMKGVYEKNQELNRAWLEQLNNSKAIKRYSTISNFEDTSPLPLSPNSITPGNVKVNVLEKEKVVYLSIKSFNTFNIDGDMKIIKPYLQSINNYKALIIDIRGNGGGNSSYWSNNIVPMLINKPLEETQYEAFRGGSFIEQFIKSRRGFGYEKLEPILNINKVNLKNLPPELKSDFKYFLEQKSQYQPNNSAGFNGKIYLLIDGAVFSSSERFAIFAKNTGFATLVGERTGGDGIGDDPAICVLPNSGYLFRFTKQMGLTSNGACNFENKTEPDIKVSAKINSNLSNDEAVQAVLKILD